MLSTSFDGFQVADFPTLAGLASIPGRPSGFVYVIFWITEGLEMPFYVGQTQRLSGRMEDYCKAHFMACTDFRVGEAIRYLRDNKHYRIVLKFRRSDERSREERAIIRNLHFSGVLLLNDLAGYHYRTAKSEEEREIVHRFCDALIRISK